MLVWKLLMLSRLVPLLLTLMAFVMGVPATSYAQDGLSSGRSANVEVTLVSQKNAAAPGETFHLAVTQNIAQGWHTYWRNSGDSGEATAITWTLPSGVTAGPIKWPTPSAIPFGPLTNYGYSGKVTFPIEVKVPASAKAGETLALVADVRWLECSDICIPGEARVGIDIPVAATSQNGPNAAAIDTALGALPKAFPGTARLTDLGAGGLQLVLQGAETPREAYFFPYEVKIGAIVDFPAPQELVRGKDGFGLTLAKSPSFPTDLKGPIGGVVVFGKGNDAKAYEVSATYQAPPEGSTAKPVPMSKAATTTQAPPAPSPSIGLLAAIGLAFLGGLILNLMPCVFPILSMKALGLMEAAHGDARSARGHGLWYGAGVIASFLVLAGVLIGLSAAGQAIGWGFQLQSPVIVLLLAILMVLIGFNLLGFYEIGTSVQDVGGAIVHSGSKSPMRTSFLTGVLAVVVAAPCTAPFMGAALGFAATQPAPVALLVFAVLGFGFATPFVALTFIPGLLRVLPRPGLWMVKLREALAFPMFVTAIWLIWVLSAQAGQAGILAVLVGVLGAALAVWIARTWTGAGGKVIAGVTLVAALAWAGFHVSSPSAQTSTAQATADDNRWTQARVAELQAQGKTVFVNFTADWCVTCKVNEVTAFQDARVKAALNGDKAVYLVADWTKRDDEIGKALASHGRVGVPLYLVYKQGVATPEILPQILSAQTILAAVE